MRKLKKAIDKKDGGAVRRLRQNKPKYKLDKIVKERYWIFPFPYLGIKLGKDEEKPKVYHCSFFLVPACTLEKVWSRTNSQVLFVLSDIRRLLMRLGI